MSVKGNLINGAWVTTEKTFNDINPSDTNDIIGVYATAGEAAKIVKLDRAFPANMEDRERSSRLSAWHEAVGRARSHRQ